MTWIDENGTEHDLHPLDLWESDDVSINQPFRYLDPATGEETTGRQTLATVDVYSAALLGGQPIGRCRDAYRVEDILDHMRWLCETHGLPKIWRLERGVWENQAIDGIRLDSTEATRLGLGGARFEGKRWGGLDAGQGGPFHIVHTWESRGKGTCESSFDHLQTIMANRGDFDTIDIGRFRGEYEKATKTLMQAHRGQEKALIKFWDIATCADRLQSAMMEFNSRPKTRAAFGNAQKVPTELLQEIPGGENFRVLTDEMRWRFYPVKKLITVRQSRIEVTAPHWPSPFFFQCNGIDDSTPFLAHGYRVLIAFHPAHPEWGCEIFNAEIGGRNRADLGFGAHILTAPLMQAVAQVDLSGIGGGSSKSRAAAAMRTEFRTTAGPARSISETRSGDGVTQTIERGQAIPTPEKSMERGASTPVVNPGVSERVRSTRSTGLPQEAPLHADSLSASSRSEILPKNETANPPQKPRRSQPAEAEFDLDELEETEADLAALLDT